MKINEKKKDEFNRLFARINDQQAMVLDYLASIGYGGGCNRQDVLRALLDRIAFDMKTIEYANFVNLNDKFINYCHEKEQMLISEISDGIMAK